MFITKILKAAAIAVPMGLASMGAQATSVPGTENFSWSFVTPTNPSVTITGNGSISLTASGTTLTAVVTLNNTTSLVSGNMALVSFGFGIDPNATGVTFQDDADGAMSAANMVTQQGSTKIPSLTGIEVCSYGGNNCSGGSVNDGIQAGGSDTFTLLLTGASAWPSTVTIAPIGFKFQGTVGSFEFYTNSTSTTTTTTTTTTGTPSTSGGVPAPASTLTLLGLGLIGMGYARRMKSAR